RLSHRRPRARLPASPLFPYTTLFRSKSTTVGHAREVWPSAVRTASGVSGPGGPTDRPAERSVERDAEFGGEGLDHVLHADLVARSEEHTSELQSRENLVCRLLLENKK